MPTKNADGSPMRSKIASIQEKKNFPEVANKYQVIADDSVTVLVPPLLGRFERREPVRSADVARGSVRIRRKAAEKMSLRPLCDRRELYAWTLDYDPDFLGYMKGVLDRDQALAGEFLSA